MKLIRWMVGRFFLLTNYVTWPRAGYRPLLEQGKLKLQLQQYTLYIYFDCIQCIKVRRHLQRLALNIYLENARLDKQRHELMIGGGKLKVPCLRIEREDGVVKWMYGSDDIIQYFTKNFPLKS